MGNAIQQCQEEQNVINSGEEKSTCEPPKIKSIKWFANKGLNEITNSYFEQKVTLEIETLNIKTNEKVRFLIKEKKGNCFEKENTELSISGSVESNSVIIIDDFELNNKWFFSNKNKASLPQDNVFEYFVSSADYNNTLIEIENSNSLKVEPICPNCWKEITIDEIKNIIEKDPKNSDKKLTTLNFSILEKVLPFLNQYKDIFNIDSCIRKSHFFAQISHESGRFSALVENVKQLSPSTLINKIGAFPNQFIELSDANLEKYKDRFVIYDKYAIFENKVWLAELEGYLENDITTNLSTSGDIKMKIKKHEADANVTTYKKVTDKKDKTVSVEELKTDTKYKDKYVVLSDENISKYKNIIEIIDTSKDRYKDKKISIAWIHGYIGKETKETPVTTDKTIKIKFSPFTNTDARVIANGAYSHKDVGSLGNKGGDDGYRYIGRGLKQLTGRYNYTEFAKYHAAGKFGEKDPDITEAKFANDTNTPNETIPPTGHYEKTAEPKYAVQSAYWFWTKRDLQNLADKDDLREISKKVTGASGSNLDAEENARGIFLNYAKKYAFDTNTHFKNLYEKGDETQKKLAQNYFESKYQKDDEDAKSIWKQLNENNNPPSKK